MGVQLFTNNADGTMSGTLAVGGVTMNLGAGQGAAFPAPTAGDFFLGTIYELDGSGQETNVEVVKTTARSTDTLTIERDFENMTGNPGGYAYNGTINTVYFSLRWTAYAAANSVQSDSLGAGVKTFLLTPSSANLAAAVTGETGTGALVFAESPALVTPALGTPASGVLTNCTGLPVVGGGTGRATGSTAYGLIAAGTTATGAQQTLAAGATTEMLVGGGAAALPVWTAATGTGAPVRATTPTITGQRAEGNAANPETILLQGTTPNTATTLYGSRNTQTIPATCTVEYNGASVDVTTLASVFTLSVLICHKARVTVGAGSTVEWAIGYSADVSAGSIKSIGFHSTSTAAASVYAFYSEFAASVFADVTIGGYGWIWDGVANSLIGYRGMPQLAKSDNYTLVLTDSGKHIYFTTGATKTITIPANSSVAFPIGTVISIVNGYNGNLSLAITTDTLRLAGVGTTGTRTLGPYSVATFIKVATTEWYVSGAGVT